MDRQSGSDNSAQGEYAPLKLANADDDDEVGGEIEFKEKRAASPDRPALAETETLKSPDIQPRAPDAPEPTVLPEGYDPDGEWAEEDMAAMFANAESTQADIDAIFSDAGITPEAAIQIEQEIAHIEEQHAYTAHWDNFCANMLPPADELPEFKFTKIWLRHPDRLNVVTELLDTMVFAGHADSPCYATAKGTWSYFDLYRDANQLAHLMMDEMGVIPGARVLLRGFNTPLLVAALMAVWKAGAVAVPTPPSMRARDLARIVDEAEVNFAICDDRLAAELAKVQEKRPALVDVRAFRGSSQAPAGAAAAFDDGDLPSQMENGWLYAEPSMAEKEPQFDNFDTAAEDICLIAFTSGTSGHVKGTMHHHRDIIVTSDCLLRSTLTVGPEDRFVCNMPLSTVVGLASAVLYPMRTGASSILLQQFDAKVLAQAIDRLGATVCISSPNSYRALIGFSRKFDLGSLQSCVSTGEPFSAGLHAAWQSVSGARLIDAIATTEMLGVFLATPLEGNEPGSTGKPVDGYLARVVDEAGREVPPNMPGRLAVKGPTGCRYLGGGEQQQAYVVDGWNMTGDHYMVDRDGFFWFCGRGDDLIDTGGYQISGPEVEDILLEHHGVEDAAVVAAPDRALKTIAKAYIVPAAGIKTDEAFINELTEFTRARLDSFKCPMAWDFVATLPRSDSGVIQRYKLRGFARRQYDETQNEISRIMANS